MAAAWYQAVSAIEARMEANWPGPERVALRNRRFEKPNPPSAWLLLEVIWSSGEQGSIGAPGDNLMRRYGHIWLHAFVPRQTPAVAASQLATRAAAIFENQDFSGVLCEAAEPGGQADGEDGNWFGQSVAIPFEWQETA